MARNLRLAGIGIFIHSSRPVGTGSQMKDSAWSQYSRFGPPGCGSGVPNFSESTGSAAIGVGFLRARAAASALAMWARVAGTPPPRAQTKALAPAEWIKLRRFTGGFRAGDGWTDVYKCTRPCTNVQGLSQAFEQREDLRLQH